MPNTLTIYHAGSVAALIKEAAQAYELSDSPVALQLHAMGSVECIKQVLQGTPVDLLVLADYSLIKELLYPQLAGWYWIFAVNRMVLAAKKDKKVQDRNWIKLLTNPSIRFGHADPEKDPCGYRAHMVWKLAEKTHPGLYNSLVRHPGRIIYSGPSPMIEDLAQEKVDYVFEYGSVAEEHRLAIYELDSSCNLSDPEKDSIYRSVSIPLNSKNNVQGSAIAYALTVPRQSQNPVEALNFAQKLLQLDLNRFGLKPFSKSVGDSPI